MCVRVCVYTHIYGFVSEREKSVAGDLDSAWNFFTFKVFALFSMLQTGILRKHTGSEGFVLHAFLCSMACYCLAEYSVTKKKYLSR